jgi:hypothetical protein
MKLILLNERNEILPSLRVNHFHTQIFFCRKDLSHPLFQTEEH